MDDSGISREDVARAIDRQRQRESTGGPAILGEQGQDKAADIPPGASFQALHIFVERQKARVIVAELPGAEDSIQLTITRRIEGRELTASLNREEVIGLVTVIERLMRMTVVEMRASLGADERIRYQNAVRDQAARAEYYERRAEELSKILELTRQQAQALNAARVIDKPLGGEEIRTDAQLRRRDYAGLSDNPVPAPVSPSPGPQGFGPAV